MIPKIKFLLVYKHFFDTEPPKNRLDLIKFIPKVHLIKSHYKKYDYTLMPPFIYTTDRFMIPIAITKRLNAAMDEIINTYSAIKNESTTVT